ncbi:hypothetical protein QWZ13_14090 [Reinekea marina]|nr:hypothetical protein [Reinekea marina]MDN3650046.1 hypothetical protein [Reinekea marina]
MKHRCSMKSNKAMYLALKHPFGVSAGLNFAGAHFAGNRKR